MLWLLNGIVFYVLLFTTGEWRRVGSHQLVGVSRTPLSALIQYLSLNWPPENDRVAYNSLQLLAYFITVFVAAPLAFITGLGMSPALSTRFKRISKVLSIQTARSLHFLVLVWFLIFIVIHVALVFTTGLLHNLNHVYAGQHRRQLERLLGLRRDHGRRRSSAGSPPPRSHSATPASCSGSATP